MAPRGARRPRSDSDTPACRAVTVTPCDTPQRVAVRYRGAVQQRWVTRVGLGSHGDTVTPRGLCSDTDTATPQGPCRDGDTYDTGGHAVTLVTPVPCGDTTLGPCSLAPPAGGPSLVGIGVLTKSTLGDSPCWGMSPCPQSPWGGTCQLQDICTSHSQ